MQSTIHYCMTVSYDKPSVIYGASGVEVKTEMIEGQTEKRSSRSWTLRWVMRWAELLPGNWASFLFGLKLGKSRWRCVAAFSLCGKSHRIWGLCESFGCSSKHVSPAVCHKRKTFVFMEWAPYSRAHLDNRSSTDHIQPTSLHFVTLKLLSK